MIDDLMKGFTQLILVVLIASAASWAFAWIVIR